jgi:hypothetical protein
VGYEGVEGVEDSFALAGGELTVEGFVGGCKKKCNGKNNSNSNGKNNSNSNGKNNSNSRSPAGMTTRKATATAGARSCECWRTGNPLQFGFGSRLGKYGDMDGASGCGAACVFGDEFRSVFGGECE